MYKKMITKVYCNKELVNELECIDAERVQNSLIEDLLQNKFSKSNKINYINYDDIESVYTETIGQNKYKTVRRYIKK